MSPEHRPYDRAASAQALQVHLCGRGDGLALPEDPDALIREMRDYLLDAADKGDLKMKPHEVLQALKRKRSPLGDPPEFTGIYGGEKDLKRTGDKPHFRRPDGAWFFFTLTVRTRKGQPLELLAYDFELNFPQHPSGADRFPRFLRFDLNQPGHRNESRELRAHMHPGHDDLIAPAPMLSPLELLDLFITGLVIPERLRKA